MRIQIPGPQVEAKPRMKNDAEIISTYPMLRFAGSVGSFAVPTAPNTKSQADCFTGMSKAVMPKGEDTYPESAIQQRATTTETLENV